MGLLDKYGVPTPGGGKSKLIPSAQYRFIFHMEDFEPSVFQTESIKIKYNNLVFFEHNNTMDISVLMRDLEISDTFNLLVKYASNCASKKIKIEQTNGLGEVIKTIYGTINFIHGISTSFDYSKAEPVHIKFKIHCDYHENEPSNDDADE